MQRIPALTTLLLCICAPLLRAQPETPSIPGFDIAAMDTSIDACEDFYRFSCGTWLKENPVPADEPRWGRFNELRDRNLFLLREILDEVSDPGSSRDENQSMVGDYYAACMDEPAIETRGAAPIVPLLKEAAALNSKDELPAFLAALHRQRIAAFFRFGSTEDFKDATQIIADIDQGGLSLPDRDYYLKDDADSKKLLDRYVAHVEAMFRLAGLDNAPAKAQVVLQMETAMAEASMDRTARRNPDNVYHIKTLAELDELAGEFAWTKYFRAAGAPAFDSLNVSSPGFFEGLNAQLGATGLEDLKTYLYWQIVRAAARLLPKRFVDENFAFFGKALLGQQEQTPRWKRCVRRVDGALGEALGQEYVRRHFSAEAKARMLELVHGLEAALAEDIENLDWMTADTKRQALIKLKGISNKIGYPDQWRDYSGLAVKRGDAFGNSRRAGAFEFARDMKKIGSRTDPNEWFMSPPTVNAYYHPLHNNINFPAGILQPPFFDMQLDDAVNYGAIGAVIGHELTHGFDDQGRRFDAAGNLRDWWTETDGKAFEERAQCFVDQYAGYTAGGGLRLNGKLTLGENTADNGGLRIAYMALKEQLKKKPAEKIDGFTPEQRLFLGWAQVWCQNQTDEFTKMQVTSDPHSPGEFRVIGVVSNSPEFRAAFECGTARPMVREKTCRVW